MCCITGGILAEIFTLETIELYILDKATDGKEFMCTVYSLTGKSGHSAADKYPVFIFMLTFTKERFNESLFIILLYLNCSFMKSSKVQLLLVKCC